MFNIDKELVDAVTGTTNVHESALADTATTLIAGGAGAALTMHTINSFINKFNKKRDYTGERVYGMRSIDGHALVDKSKEGTILSHNNGVHHIRWDNGDESHHHMGNDDTSSVDLQSNYKSTLYHDLP